ncbi:multidrug effflux MFS transporter [Pseudomonas cremoricolorata]|uniref:Bcr/CflA family efflux transporter n=1 Tax=Pseudomonas cremoricolorata TaxID=157783 RepID=A0A089YG65_9PSED|nr:multidrug effflux MFS transporter [Pseudomonas cremoricolorata]AIR90683.1 MFS transporter [Pseudomonas cremoricolorata]
MSRTPVGTVLLLASLTAIVPLSIDINLPAMPAIAADLQASSSSVQSTVGTFLLGLCLGMLCYGPLADRFGRRPLLLAGGAVYLVATLACIFASDIDQLVLARFFQALGGAAASVLGRAVVSDRFALTEAARVLTLMHLVTMIATLLSPIVGSALLALTGWRSIFVALGLFVAVVMASTAWRLQESLPPSRRSASLGSAFLAYLGVLRAPLALAYMGCMGLALGGMFGFMTGSPFVYAEHFGLSPGQYAWLMALNFVSIIGLTLINARLVRRHGPQRMIGIGVLLTLLACAGLLHAALAESVGLVQLVLCVMLYIGATGLLGANSIACLMALFPNRSGAAAGLAISAQFALASLCSGITARVVGNDPGRLALVMVCAGVGSAACYGLVLAWRRRARLVSR